MNHLQKVINLESLKFVQLGEENPEELENYILRNVNQEMHLQKKAFNTYFR